MNEKNAGWGAERDARLRVERNAAFWVAGAATVSMTAMAIAVAVMIPLKQTVPYLIEVNKATGEAQVIDAVNRRSVDYDELNAKYWAAKYVVARESYFFTLLQTDYDSVFAMSTTDVASQYNRMFEGGTNKQQVLGAATEERIEVLSITLEKGTPGVNLDRAVIRFKKTTRQVDRGFDVGTGQYVSTLSYRWVPNRTGKEVDLLRNPLGFEVVGYRVDEEFVSKAK